MREALRDIGIMLIPMFPMLGLVVLRPQASLFLPSLVSPELLR